MSWHASIPRFVVNMIVGRVTNEQRVRMKLYDVMRILSMDLAKSALVGKNGERTPSRPLSLFIFGLLALHKYSIQRQRCRF